MLHLVFCAFHELAYIVSSTVKALKVETLGQLDEGDDSLEVLQRLGQAQTIESRFSALTHVFNDYLWTKTTTERAFRKYPHSSDPNKDKKVFRDGLIRVHEYATKSLVPHASRNHVSQERGGGDECRSSRSRESTAWQPMHCPQASRFAVISARTADVPRPHLQALSRVQCVLCSHMYSVNEGRGDCASFINLDLGLF